jgi:hypothetical protein
MTPIAKHNLSHVQLERVSKYLQVISRNAEKDQANFDVIRILSIYPKLQMINST